MNGGTGDLEVAPPMRLEERLREGLIRLRCAFHVKSLRRVCLSFGEVRLQLRCKPRRGPSILL
jgi:hypothetical protein